MEEARNIIIIIIFERVFGVTLRIFLLFDRGGRFLGDTLRFFIHFLHCQSGGSEKRRRKTD